ncbi:MAG: serine/threonine protein kinase [Cuspidothrix sp.]
MAQRQKNQPLTEKQAIDWLRKLAKILERVHNKGFIHRDINPSNIMLKNNGGQIVLIDFDAGRQINQAVSDKKHLTVIGTNGYIPPEQRKGRAVPQSDFYALGITFVHLLTGKHPNELEQDRDGKLRWHSSAPQISKDLAYFIDQLMARSSENRPKNTAEILQKLETIERDLDKKIMFDKWLRVNFKKTSRFIVFALVPLIGIYGIYAQNNQNKTKPNQAEPNPISTSVTIPNDTDTLCRTQKDGKGLNANALADAANAAIISVTDQSSPNRINLPRNRFAVKGQNGCKVIINVYLSQGEQLTSEQKQLIRSRIEENIYPEAVKLPDVDFQIPQ